MADESVPETDEFLDCNPMSGTAAQGMVLELTPLDGESRTIALDNLLGGGYGVGNYCQPLGVMVDIGDSSGDWRVRLSIDTGNTGHFRLEGEGFTAVVPLDEPTCISPVRLELEFLKSPQEWRYVSWRSSWDSVVGDVTVEELEADPLKILAHSDLELSSATYGSLRLKSTLDVHDRCAIPGELFLSPDRDRLARSGCQRDLARSAATYGCFSGHLAQEEFVPGIADEMRAECDRCSWMRPVDCEQGALYVISLSKECQAAASEYLACEDVQDPGCQYLNGSPPCEDLQQAMWDCDRP